MSGELVKINPDGTEESERWEGKGRPPYETLRRLVGGVIQPVKVRWGGKIRECYVHEEGMLLQLPSNRRLRELAADGYGKPIYLMQIFHGPGVIWIPDPRK